VNERGGVRSGGAEILFVRLREVAVSDPRLSDRAGLDSG
jgi:hypothetical protein